MACAHGSTSSAKCKICVCAYRKAHYQRNRERLLKYQRDRRESFLGLGLTSNGSPKAQPNRSCTHGIKNWSKCRECRRAYKREWFERPGNRERHSKRTKTWRTSNLEKARSIAIESSRKWRRRNRDLLLNALRQQRQSVIDALGGACASGGSIHGCGWYDRDLLELDHIAGDGHADFGFRGIQRAVSELKKNGNNWLRAKYQLLCANCHRRKTRSNGEFCRIVARHEALASKSVGA